MDDRDTVEFVTAFAIGAILGVGATLLLSPERSRPAKKLLKQLQPLPGKAGKRARRAWRGVRGGADAALERGGDLAEAGRDALDDFREDVSEIVSSARDEIARAIEAQVSNAQKSLRKGSRRVRR